MPTPNVQSVSINRSVLVGAEVWLCVAQIRRDVLDIKNDVSNAEAVGLVESLLKVAASGFAPIDESCPRPELLRILVLPELAFGWEDVDRIDAAVRAYPKPLMLVAGFGFTKAERLRGHAGFVDEHIPNSRLVNYGCTWISLQANQAQPATHQLLYYCKNFPEQKLEKPLIEPMLGSDILALEFSDLTVHPVICADLIEDSQANRPSAVDRIRSHSDNRPNQPVLIIGSLLQREPWHPIWKSKLDTTVAAVPSVLALANIAETPHPNCYADDVARNLSGAYTAVAAHTHKPATSAWCAHRHEETLTGHPLRDSRQLVVGGTLRLKDYSSSKGRHLWSPQWGKVFVDGVIKDAPGNSLHYEMSRLLTRTLHPVEGKPVPLTELKSHVAVATPERVPAMLSSLLRGPIKSNPETDPCRSSDANRAAETGLRCTDALRRADGFGWPASDAPALRFSAAYDAGAPQTDVDTYVWASYEQSWQAMTDVLTAYVQEPRALPGLIVVAEDKNATSLVPDDIQRLYDSTQPAELPELEDVARPRSVLNRIAVLGLTEAKRLSSVVGNADEFRDISLQISEKIRKQLLGGAK